MPVGMRRGPCALVLNRGFPHDAQYHAATLVRLQDLRSSAGWQSAASLIWARAPLVDLLIVGMACAAGCPCNIGPSAIARELAHLAV